MGGGPKIIAVQDAIEEVLLLWSFRDPSRARQGALVKQKALHLDVDVCGRIVRLAQSHVSELSNRSKLM
jgi:hypothetical protein